MQWLFSHLYLAVTALAFAIIGFGTLIVVNRSDVKPELAGLRAWGGVGSNLFDPTDVRTKLQPIPQENLYTEVQSGPPFYYAPESTPLPLVHSGADDFNFEEFIALLSTPPKKDGGGGSEAGIDAYSFIPQGLISAASSEKTRTPTQQTLFNYGNEAASYIQTYEERYRAAPQILKDQFEDRGDPEKNAALLSLAGALEEVGYQLEDIEEIPPEVSATHQKVAASYKELGKKLALLPEAKTDKELIDTMLSYNAAVGTYQKNFIMLATLFSAYGVTFAPADPGSIFTFSPAPTF